MDNSRHELPHPAALLYQNRHLLHDLCAEAFKGGNVHGDIRQQPDAVDAFSMPNPTWHHEMLLAEEIQTDSYNFCIQ